MNQEATGNKWQISTSTNISSKLLNKYPNVSINPNKEYQRFTLKSTTYDLPCSSDWYKNNKSSKL